MLQTDPGFRTKDIIQANMIYESNDYSSYTSETVNQRKERVLAIDQLIDNCPESRICLQHQIELLIKIDGK